MDGFSTIAQNIFRSLYHFNTPYTVYGITDVFDVQSSDAGHCSTLVFFLHSVHRCQPSVCRRLVRCLVCRRSAVRNSVFRHSGVESTNCTSAVVRVYVPTVQVLYFPNFKDVLRPNPKAALLCSVQNTCPNYTTVVLCPFTKFPEIP
jgi:hypothetical protein